MLAGDAPASGFTDGRLSAAIEVETVAALAQMILGLPVLGVRDAQLGDEEPTSGAEILSNLSHAGCGKYQGRRKRTKGKAA